MRNACAIPVENTTLDRVAEQLLYTAGRISSVFLWLSAGLFRVFLPACTTPFPQHFFVELSLLQTRFYPLSTAPITRATFSEKNY